MRVRKRTAKKKPQNGKSALRDAQGKEKHEMVARWPQARFAVLEEKKKD
jgi:hypothetical protein